MMGITMSDADPRVVERLIKGVDGGILLDSVVEGLAASKAGLQKDDLIIEVEGTRSITQEKLREILRGKKPGDELKLKYIRQGGNETETTIKLEAFDGKKLGTPEAASGWRVNGTPFSFKPGGFDHEELHKILAGAIGDLRSKAEDTKELREKVAKQLEKALEQIDAQRKQLEDMLTQFGNKEWPRIGQFLPDDGSRVPNGGGNGGGMVIRPFAPGEQPDARGGNDPFEGMADRLSEKLDRLNKRLEELEKRLNEKK